MKTSVTYRLLAYVIGDEEAVDLLSKTAISEALLLQPARGDVDSTCIAQAFVLVLWHDFLRRVPSARRYVDSLNTSTERIELDHFVLHTVCRVLGADVDAIDRLLTPMGYEIADTWMQPNEFLQYRLYRHAALPVQIPQVVVSEFSLAGMPEHVISRVYETFETSRDQMSPLLLNKLAILAQKGSLPFHDAADVVLKASRCLDRHHDLPRLDDYAALAELSPALAWILTEGQSCAALSVRSSDVEATRSRLIDAGLDVLPGIAMSEDNYVKQIVLPPSTASRRLRGAASSFIEETVTGSRFRLIERCNEPNGSLALSINSAIVRGDCETVGPASQPIES